MGRKEKGRRRGKKSRNAKEGKKDEAAKSTTAKKMKRRSGSSSKSNPDNLRCSNGRKELLGRSGGWPHL